MASLLAVLSGGAVTGALMASAINDPNSSSAGRIAAVVDWEMSTLGDPLTDVALMCIYRQPVFDTVLGFSAAWTSDRYPSADAIAERYATATGIDLGDWDFYLALANLKLGVIAEGISHRARAGASSGDGAENAAAATGEFIARGLAHINRGRRVAADTTAPDAAASENTEGKQIS